MAVKQRQTLQRDLFAWARQSTAGISDYCRRRVQGDVSPTRFSTLLSAVGI